MSIWQTLGIDATRDESTIRSAYRQQLRDCHPETDPEGFQRLRDAFEQAMAQTAETEQDVAVAAPPEKTPVTEPLYTEQTGTEPAPEPSAPVPSGEGDSSRASQQMQLMQQLLDDPARRLDRRQWQSWLDTCSTLSLAAQSQISHQASVLMLDYRWLPGDLVDWLWQPLDWAMLLRDQAQQSLAEHLDYWRRNHSALPLNWLAQQSHNRQRALLNSFQPLSAALQQGNIGYISFLLHNDSVTSFEHPSQALLLLRCWRALDFFDHDRAMPLLDWLLQQPPGWLSADDLYVMGEFAVRCNNEKLMFHLVDQLLEQQHPLQASQLLYLWYQPRNQVLSCWLGLQMKRHGDARAPMFWHAEQQLYTLDEQSPLALHWLCDLLWQGHSNHIRQAQQLAEISDCHTQLLALQWGLMAGDQAFVTRQLELPFSAPVSLVDHDGWYYVDRLIRLQAAPVSEQLARWHTLLPALGDANAEAPPLNDQQLQALGAVQWQELVIRYHALPEHWQHQLTERGLINPKAVQAMQQTCGITPQLEWEQDASQNTATGAASESASEESAATGDETESEQMPEHATNALLLFAYAALPLYWFVLGDVSADQVSQLLNGAPLEAIDGLWLPLAYLLTSLHLTLRIYMAQPELKKRSRNLLVALGLISATLFSGSGWLALMTVLHQLICYGELPDSGKDSSDKDSSDNKDTKG